PRVSMPPADSDYKIQASFYPQSEQLPRKERGELFLYSLAPENPGAKANDPHKGGLTISFDEKEQITRSRPDDRCCNDHLRQGAGCICRTCGIPTTVPFRLV